MQAIRSSREICLTMLFKVFITFMGMLCSKTSAARLMDWQSSKFWTWRSGKELRAQARGSGMATYEGPSNMMWNCATLQMLRVDAGVQRETLQPGLHLLSLRSWMRPFLGTFVAKTRRRGGRRHCRQCSSCLPGRCKPHWNAPAIACHGNCCP